MKHIRSVTFLLIVPLLMSAANANTTNVSSPVFGGNILVNKNINSGSRSANCLSNVLNNVAASVKFTCEFYKMYKQTELLVNYVESYSFIYRIDIYLNHAVKYKGGVFNWFDGENPTYLNDIDISVKFKGVSNIGEIAQYPHNLDGINILNTNPYLGVQYEDDNRLYNNNYDMTTNNSFSSTSYWKNNDEIVNIKCDSRLAALVNTYSNIDSNFLTLTTSLDYGYEIDQWSGKIKKDDNGNWLRNNLYSGPSKDQESFNFCFFGAMNFESETQPYNVDVDVYMKTTHGSTVALDTFSSSTNVRFTI